MTELYFSLTAISIPGVACVFSLSVKKNMNNLNRAEQLMRFALGAGLVGYSIGRNRGLLMTGIASMLSGLTGYCPVKSRLTKLLEPHQPRMSRSEMSHIPVSDIEDSGGYRTGNPIHGTTSHTREQPVNI